MEKEARSQQQFLWKGAWKIDETVRGRDNDKEDEIALNHRVILR